MRLMGECRGSIDAVKRAEEELTEGDVSGLSNPNTVDAQGKGQSHAQACRVHRPSLEKPLRVVALIKVSPRRCDRALGADPGSVYERQAPAQAQRAAVAAADLGPANHEGLAGSDRGRAGPAARPRAQHRHPHHPAEDQEAQGLSNPNTRFLLSMSLLGKTRICHIMLAASGVLAGSAKVRPRPLIPSEERGRGQKAGRPSRQ